jgi:hypothetical protein
VRFSFPDNHFQAGILPAFLCSKESFTLQNIWNTGKMQCSLRQLKKKI